ncbi:MAG: hypothetical protein B6A08_15295 [Sorangiineae bacterium NIC37A_2]|jgi:hypothetical protein|nr:MAG: hypothetical protein B6A08_15295 [Sorangiineae bacterium NIC37A_2]
MLKTRSFIALSLLLAACSGAQDPGGEDGNSGDGSGSGAAPSGTGAQGNGSGTGGSTGHPGDPPACESGVAATSQLRRLTNAQYDKTVAKLLGLTELSGAPPSSLLVPDNTGSMNGLMWSSYQTVAEQIAREVMADPNLRKNFLKCELTGDGAACLSSTIDEFGRRAFRRPLSPEDKARFQKLVDEGAAMTPNGTPEEVAELLLYGLLISSGFLERQELTGTKDSSGRVALSGHEIASRLSYMLTGTMPDELLSQAADSDELKTPDQILEHATRLLEMPEAREVVARYHREYLGYIPGNSRWDSPARVGKGPDFKGFKKELVPAMMAETEKLFDKVTFDQEGSFKDLLLTQVGFVNAGTAALYGISGDFGGDELREVDLGPERPGFLTRLAFLAGFSDFDRASPILRGAFISQRVIGVHIDSPDPNAINTPLPTSADLDTNRKQVDAQTSGGPCLECHHTYINPPGFVMEAFDTVGAPQTTEKRTGAPIDTKAEITLAVGAEPVPVNSPAELMEVIATSKEANRFYAQSILSSAYERLPNEFDACVVDDLGTKLLTGYSIKNLLADLARTEAFRTRTIEEN